MLVLMHPVYASGPDVGKLLYLETRKDFDLAKGTFVDSSIIDSDSSDLIRLAGWAGKEFYIRIDPDLESVNSEDSGQLYSLDVSTGITTNICSTGEIRRALKWYFNATNELVYASADISIDSNQKNKTLPIKKVFYTYRIGKKSIKKILTTDDIYPWSTGVDPSFSYTGSCVNYINKAGQLIELDITTMQQSVIADLNDFLLAHRDDRILRLGPSSPDRKYFPIIAGKSLYLVDRTGKVRFIYGQFLSYLGKGAEGPMFWDKESQYLIFFARFGWLPTFDYLDRDVAYYSMRSGEVKKIDTGISKNQGVWYVWE